MGKTLIKIWVSSNFFKTVEKHPRYCKENKEFIKLAEFEFQKGSLAHFAWLAGW